MSGDISNERSVFVLYLARELKNAQVRHPLRDDLMHPVLIPFAASELMGRCLLPSDWLTRPSVLRDAIVALTPDEIAIVAEVFVSLSPTLRSAGLSQSDRFPDGDPSLIPAIGVLRMTRSGDGEQTILPYRYADDAVVWDEAQYLDPPKEAAVETLFERATTDAIAAGFRQIEEPRERDEARSMLRSLGLRVMFTDEAQAVFDVGPDDPCPCESGRVFKNCHDY